MSAKNKIHIGTSGWHYNHWIEKFYPSGMKPKDFKDYYLYAAFNALTLIEMVTSRTLRKSLRPLR